MQQGDIAAEMERARVDFHHLLDNATNAELRAGTDGTKWTNEQLLFHMLFGYLLVRNLLILVKACTRLPRRVHILSVFRFRMPRRGMGRSQRRLPDRKPHGRHHLYRHRHLDRALGFIHGAHRSEFAASRPAGIPRQRALVTATYRAGNAAGGLADA